MITKCILSLYKQYRPCHTDYTIVITPSELKINSILIVNITEVLGAPCCRMGLSLEVGSFFFQNCLEKTIIFCVVHRIHQNIVTISTPMVWVYDVLKRCRIFVK